MKCKYCGETFDNKYTGLTEQDECFTCWHWRTNHEKDQEGNQEFAIIDGHHYVIAADKENCNHQMCFCGFGGRRFIIKFFDGRTIETRNLWHQGKISPYWRQYMPDNAEFVPELKWTSNDEGIISLRNPEHHCVTLKAKQRRRKREWSGERDPSL